MTLIRKSLLLIALLAVASGLRAQTSTTFTIHVIAPPSCVVTLNSSPISKTGLNLLAGQAGVVNFNVSACSAAAISTASATWDGVTLSVVAPFSVNITAAQATAGDHALILVIPTVQPVLTMNSPLELPNATVGQPYSVDLAQLAKLQKGGIPCQTCIFSSSSLSSGLSLSANGVITGTPTSSVAGGSFSFVVTDNPLLAMNETPAYFRTLPFRYRIR